MQTPVYHAAVQAALAMAARELARIEREDPDVAGVHFEVYADGQIDVQLLNGQAIPVGGYSL